MMRPSRPYRLPPGPEDGRTDLDAVGAAARGEGRLVTDMLKHADGLALAALRHEQRPGVLGLGLAETQVQRAVSWRQEAGYAAAIHYFLLPRPHNVHEPA